MSTFIRVLAWVLTRIGSLCDDGMHRGQVMGKLCVGLAFLAPGVLVFFSIDCRAVLLLLYFLFSVVLSCFNCTNKLVIFLYDG